MRRDRQRQREKKGKGEWQTEITDKLIIEVKEERKGGKGREIEREEGVEIGERE